MALQLNHKATDAKQSLASGPWTHLQGNARVQKDDTHTTIKKMTTVNTVPRARFQTKRINEAENKPPTFHPFVKLPAELQDMIVEEAVDYAPAIVYGHVKMSKKTPQTVIINTGSKGGLSKFKELVRLASDLPVFKKIMERKFGQPFDCALSRTPTLGLRWDKDLMVFIFDHRPRQNFNWMVGKQRTINRETLAPGIKNVGILYCSRDCHGLLCGTSCNMCGRTNAEQRFCPWEAAWFCQNLSHVENFFVLFKLELVDLVEASQTGYLNVMKDLLDDATLIRDHVVFKDSERTWVEISNRSPTRTVCHLRTDPLRNVFRHIRKAQSLTINGVSQMAGANGRQNIRFRVLLASRWKDTTLGI